MTQKDTNTWIYFLLYLAFALIIGTGLYFSYQVQKTNARIENIDQPQGEKQ